MSSVLLAPEDVQEIENQFFIGNYHDVISSAGDLVLSDPVATVFLEFYVLRSHLALGDAARVISSVDSSSSSVLQSVRVAAEYMQARSAGDAAKKTAALDRIKDMVKGQGDAGEAQALINVMAASILLMEGEFADALRAVHNEDSLEGFAILIHTYLRMSRLDLAQTAHQAMVKADRDESVITQLAEAWVHCAAAGGDQLKEAVYIYQGLGEQFAVTVKTLNGQAICHMLQGNFSEALDLLGEALERNKNDAETLTNAYLCAMHSHAAADIRNDYFARLRKADPFSPLVVEVDAKEGLFDRAAQKYVAAK